MRATNDSLELLVPRSHGTKCPPDSKWHNRSCAACARAGSESQPEAEVTKSGQFRRELLPRAAAFWRHELGKLSRPSRGWARSRCPLHGGDNPTSFSVNLESGAFFCFACGASGSDLIDYVIQRDHTNFQTAAQLLGAWDRTPETAKLHAERLRRRRERGQAQDARAEFERRERQMRLELRDEIHLYERIQRRCRDRLAAVLAGGEEQFSGEKDVLWVALSACQDLLRKSLAGYALLSSGPMADRTSFVRGDAVDRQAIVSRVLLSGFVDDDGRIAEVHGD